MYNRHQYPFVALNIAVASGKPHCLSWNKRKLLPFLCTDSALPCCFIQSAWMWTLLRTNGRFLFKRRNCFWLLWRVPLSTCMRPESIRSAWITCVYPLPVRNDQSHLSPHLVHAVHVLAKWLLSNFVCSFLCRCISSWSLSACIIWRERVARRGRGCTRNPETKVVT